MLLSSPADFLFKTFCFKKKTLKNTTRVSDSMDLDQARRSVGSDFISNCFKVVSRRHSTASKETC